MELSRNHQGFTLIELMVVVAIIGVLMAAGIVAFTGAQRNARDAERRADIDAISKANEQFYNNGTYLYATAAAGLTTYFPNGAAPTDPNGSAYTYSVNAGRTSYCVCALLEVTGRGNATTAGASGVCAYGTGNYFCASSRQ